MVEGLLARHPYARASGHSPALPSPMASVLLPVEYCLVACSQPQLFRMHACCSLALSSCDSAAWFSFLLLRDGS